MEPFSLVGVNGNAFCVMGYVKDAMRKAGFNKNEIDNYFKTATAGDYDMLIVYSMDILDECNKKLGLEEFEDEEWCY